MPLTVEKESKFWHYVEMGAVTTVTYVAPYYYSTVLGELS